MNHWLMKSEPNVFSIDDLARKGVEPWDGVRNYQARNMIRDQMRKGDLAFFYHSSCEVPGIVGIMEIVKKAYPDSSALDPNSPFYDDDGELDQPRWYRVDVRFKQKFPEIIPLARLKQHPQLLDMALLRKGNRLSVMPVTLSQWQIILTLFPAARL
jgi:predicted RNA-binding protein with PUA-like domain